MGSVPSRLWMCLGNLWESSILLMSECATSVSGLGVPWTPGLGWAVGSAGRPPLMAVCAGCWACGVGGLPACLG